MGKLKKIVSEFWNGKINKDGTEILDPKPHRVAMGLPEDKDVIEEIRAMQSSALARAAELSGFESEEEANDFGPDDDMDDTPPTPHEDRFRNKVNEEFDEFIEKQKRKQNPNYGKPAPKKWKRRKKAADGSVSEEEYEEVI